MKYFRENATVPLSQHASNVVVVPNGCCRGDDVMACLAAGGAAPKPPEVPDW